MLFLRKHLFAMALLSSLRLRLCLLGLGLWANHVDAVSSAGCEGAQTIQVSQTINVTLDDRWYLLYFPVEYEPTSPAPVILSYHGGNRNASQQQTLDLLSTPFFNEDYIVVYPNGIDVSVSSTTTGDFPRSKSSGRPGLLELTLCRKDGRACRAQRRMTLGLPVTYLMSSRRTTASIQTASSPLVSLMARAL